MKRIINKVAVIGSGVMGSRISAHFANIGCNVLLLDIIPRELNETEIKKGLSLDDKKVRNRIVNDNLNSILKSNPSPVYDKSVISNISVGNLEDDLDKLSTCDWIIEVVVERLDIKNIVFEKIEKYRKPGTLISSNTSGIPIHSMLENRSEDFKKHFCGTHFFNPPRYLKLLEIIPTDYTSVEVVEFLKHYGDLYLGKTVVVCKDTPAFIANRIGVFSIMAVFNAMQKVGLSFKEVDTLTGPLTGKPKSATFRTADVVGIDTLVHVAENIYKDCPNDEYHEIFNIPQYVKKMVEQKILGDKTKGGFYKKSKDAEGKREILQINPETFEYEKIAKPKFASVAAAKPIDKLSDRLKMLIASPDKAGEFLRQINYDVFAYSSNRIPEISDELYKIDDGMRTGFGWDVGPFEIWDILGVEKTIKKMTELEIQPAAWVSEMVSAGFDKFYKVENGVRKFYDIVSKSYKTIPGKEGFIIIDNLREKSPVWKNSGCTLHDVGDGIVNLEFQTKMNSIGSEILEGINKSIEIAEKDFSGMVIGNNGPHFSAGANLAMMFMLATEQEFDEINFAVRAFQNATMRIRYSDIPVVVAPHNLVLGGGCEVCLHADKIEASAETYIGLVEVGVGIIPAGGGTKEMTLRASDSYNKELPELPNLQSKFMNIAMAKVSTSAKEAFNMNYFIDGRDSITINYDRVLKNAKAEALILAHNGYSRPKMREDIKVLGRSALASLLLGAYSFHRGKYISSHDKKIAEKLAYIMCGGDLTEGSLVSEQYLLDLEREAFLSLITEKKTLERIQSILTTGKPLRN